MPSIGGGGGSIDLDGLQDSLKNGGVEGLNKMLKAMAAANGMHDDQSAHLTKDASGNAMYDFRDIAGGAKPAPAVQVTSQPTRQAAEQPPAASSPPVSMPPVPDFGISEPKPHGPAKPSLATTRVTARPPPAPADQADDSDGPEQGDDEDALAPPDQKGNPVAAPVPQARVAEVVLGRTAPAAPVSQETAVALASGLESMRQNLDTLLGEANSMLHAPQKQAPAVVAPQAVASASSVGGMDESEILRRLQAIEDENKSLRREQSVQASRLQAVEAKEQKEDAEQKMLEQENTKLRDQIKVSQHASFLQDKTGLRTFFHKKEKLRRH